MRRFLVRVNGEEYEVEVAEVREEGESHWNIRDIKVVPSPSPLQVTPLFGLLCPEEFWPLM